MTLLYGVLPPLMAWQLRDKLRGSAQQQQQQQQQQQHRQGSRAETSSAPGPGLADPQAQQAPWWQQAQQAHEELVPGGAPVLAGLFCAATAIGLSRLAADAGLLTGGHPSSLVQVGFSFWQQQ